MIRIYYSDGSTFGTDEPETAPRTGVICAIGYDIHGRRYVMKGWDWYRWDEPSQSVWGHDIFGLVDWLRGIGFVSDVVPGAPTLFNTKDGLHDIFGLVEIAKAKLPVYEGRSVTNVEYEAILERARSDPDFPLE